MVEESVDRRLSAGTLLRVLIGDRAAIEQAARDRTSLLIGACLVVVGGLARSYDHAYLPHEPWVLIRGFPVTLVISGTIFLLLVIGGAKKPGMQSWPRLWPAYLGFLSVYWLTAPMAWLYAIAYERFMDPAAAMSANLWTLFVVSVWRVMLMSHIVSVLFRTSFVASIFIVMLVCEAAAGAALFLYQGPTISVMGGIAMPPQDEVLAEATFMVGLFVVFTAPFWILAGAISLWWISPSFEVLPSPRRRRIATSAYAMVLAPFALLCGLLFITQREQYCRATTESLLTSGRVADAVNFMRTRTREEYPPNWEPPPREAWHDRRPTEAELVEGLAQAPWDNWGAEVLGRRLEGMCVPWYRGGRFSEIRDQVAQTVKETSSLGRHDDLCSHTETLKLLLERAEWLAAEDTQMIAVIIEACENGGRMPAGVALPSSPF